MMGPNEENAENIRKTTNVTTVDGGHQKVVINTNDDQNAKGAGQNPKLVDTKGGSILKDSDPYTDTAGGTSTMHGTAAQQGHTTGSGFHDSHLHDSGIHGSSHQSSGFGHGSSTSHDSNTAASNENADDGLAKTVANMKEAGQWVKDTARKAVGKEPSHHNRADVV
jgi:hypothetical protein